MSSRTEYQPLAGSSTQPGDEIFGDAPALAPNPVRHQFSKLFKFCDLNQ